MAERGLHDRGTIRRLARVSAKSKVGPLDAGEGGNPEGGRNETIPLRIGFVGLSPTDPHNGIQTKVEYRFDLLPQGALFAAAGVMHEGVKKGYDGEGWKELTTHEQLNHAMGHIVGHLNGDRQEDHLGHAIVRLMMAWQTRLETGI